MVDEPQISVRDLRFRFPDGTEAIKGVNLEVRNGEFLAIIGQNGCGKTTLVKQFNGLLRPTEGDVVVEGINTKEATIARLSRMVGYAFQNPDHQIFSTSIFDEIAFGLRNLGFPESETAGGVKKALASMRLEGREKDNPLFLAKGERQRVAIASVLVMSPHVLVLDEPTTGQDWRNIVTLMDLMRELNQQKEQTVIVITHNMHVVARWTKRVVVMAEGRIISDGTPAETFAKTEVLTRAFITAPQCTRLAEELGLGAGVLTPQQLLDRVLQANSPPICS
jgi:energy-coupling factor transport system ATP-binding protein